jgi:predicted DNA-binding transcriptional regulator YafY
MNRLDRCLGILLLLRQGQTKSAAELAARFEVSVRTIYRDVEALCELGAPIYAEMGRMGGFRLLEGYFLPPVMFTRGEATSLLLGLTLLRQLRVLPFPNEVETAEHKLLAALPDPLRSLLARAGQIIGFEDLPLDIFHWGPSAKTDDTLAVAGDEANESQFVNTFLRALFEGQGLRLRYRSPYQSQTKEQDVTPCGLLWDRDWWYLAGHRVGQPAELRLWRADRVLALELRPGAGAPALSFDIRRLLGRQWLDEAMHQWVCEAPVKLRLTAHQAARLKQDWYYAHAQFEDLPGGEVLMRFGEDNPAFVFDLLRWLGPGAELLEPAAWRAELCAELCAMLAAHRAE